MRILVADDVEDTRNTLAVALETMGHAVVGAADGVEALSMIAIERPDVALIDIGMPRLDGIAVARAIKRNVGWENIYLIACTGYDDADHVADMLAAGFDQRLLKPLWLEDLAAALDAVSRAQRSRPEALVVQSGFVDSSLSADEFFPGRGYCPSSDSQRA